MRRVEQRLDGGGPGKSRIGASAHVTARPIKAVEACGDEQRQRLVEARLR